METNRRYFIQPTKEHELAANLLSEAADALLVGDIASARTLVVGADFKRLRDYAQKIAGKYDEAIHQFREMPGAPLRTKHKVKQRMPGKRAATAIFERDGWRCRFCEVRVISTEAIKVLNEQFPEKIRNRAPMREIHGGIRALAVSLDHVLPHSRGGDNSDQNLVAACGPCQFGRNQWTLEEVGFADPRSRAPIVDEWDGLTRLNKLTK